MTHEEEILARLEHLENRIAPMTETARTVSELRDELAPRVNEAVHALIRELADVEADFQMEDLLHLVKKTLRNTRNLSFTLDQLKNLIDFAVTVEPLLKSSVPQIILYLDELERSGAFRLLQTGIETLKAIGESFTQDDLGQMRTGLVRLAGTLKAVCRPEAIELIERAAQLPSKVDLTAARTVGPWGLLWALGDDDIKQGLGVVLELTRGLATLKPPQPV
ncbi:MAG: DUF1641 domain-containing protein [Desulfosarcina sp.]